MKIRNRLTFQFTLIVASILIILSIGIYYFSASFRRIEFSSRLEMRANSNAKLLLDINEIDDKLLQIIDRNTISSLSDLQLLILDKWNKIVYFGNNSDTSVIERLNINQIVTSEKVRFSFDGYEGIGFIYIDKHNTEYKIICWAVDKIGIQQLENLKYILIISFVFGLVITSIAGYFFSKRSLKPISKVINQVDTITASNLNLRLDIGNNSDEIAQLSDTFNKMLQRLEDAFKMQRGFVSNASHELRTPLTAITGQIEVALLNKREINDYQELLKSLLDDIKSLNALSNGLLELANINSDQTGLKYIPVRLDDILFESQASLQKNHSDYTIHIYFIEPPDDDNKLNIMGNPNLLSIAFKNILDNACKFSDNKRAEVGINCFGNFIKIAIKDSGIGIPEDELNKVFLPFYRAKNSTSRYGHGIGLALSKKIIELHKGKLSIKSKENVGTEIELLFNVV